jgi:hypothetical protein
MMAWIQFLVYPVGAMLLGWIFLWVGTKIVKHAWGKCKTEQTYYDPEERM